MSEVEGSGERDKPMGFFIAFWLIGRISLALSSSTGLLVCAQTYGLFLLIVGQDNWKMKEPSVWRKRSNSEKLAKLSDKWSNGQRSVRPIGHRNGAV